MKPEMLESQIQAFEPVSVDENVITVDGNQRPEEIVEAIMGRAIQLCPGMKKPWWQRYIE
jgi:gluconate kinase